MELHDYTQCCVRFASGNVDSLYTQLPTSKKKTGIKCIISSLACIWVIMAIFENEIAMGRVESMPNGKSIRFGKFIKMSENSENNLVAPRCYSEITGKVSFKFSQYSRYMLRFETCDPQCHGYRMGAGIKDTLNSTVRWH